MTVGTREIDIAGLSLQWKVYWKVRCHVKRMNICCFFFVKLS